MRSQTIQLLAFAALPAMLSAQLAPPRHSATPRTPDDWSAFERLFDAYADSDRVVGASVLVMRDGRILDRHDYGWADRAVRQRVDDETAADRQMSEAIDRGMIERSGRGGSGGACDRESERGKKATNAHDRRP
jgi:hypothetical protein